MNKFRPRVATSKNHLVKRSGDRRTLLLAYLAVLGMLCTMMPSGVNDSINHFEVLLYLVLSLAVCCLHIMAHREANWFRIDTLFILSFMIVNFQWPAMLIVDNILPGYDEAYRVDKNLAQRFEMYATYASWLSALGITGWAAGFVMVRSHNHSLIVCVSKCPDIQVNGLQLARIVTMVLLILFVALAGSGFLSGDINRDSLESITGTITGPAAYVQILLKTAIITLVGAELFEFIARSRNGERITISIIARNTGLFIAIPYSIINFLAGERGEMIQIFVIFGIIYGMHFRAFRAWEFFGAILAGALFFTIIGHTRQHGWSEIDIFLTNFNLWRATINLANSSVCLFVAIEVTELKGTYYWGQLMVTNLLSVVPFAQTIVTTTFEISSINLNSAYMFAVYLYGPNPHTSPGTSITADAYVNFGAVGVFVILFLYGAVCSYFTAIARAAVSLEGFVAAAAFASLIFYIGRASVLTQWQPTLWAIGFALLFYKVRRLRYSSRLQPVNEAPPQPLRNLPQ